MLGPIISGIASLAGGIIGQNKQEQMAEKNIALQKEFAQSGIQWKVEDAKKAGVHPLYALGANTTSFSPVSVGSPLAEGISRMGQDVSRAMHATSNPMQRTVMGLTVEKAGLENELLRAQIAKLRNQSGPPVPTATDPWSIPGQSGSGITVTNPADLAKADPLKYTVVDPSAPHGEPVPQPHISWIRTPTGYMPVPGKEAKDRMEDMGFSPWIWSITNQVAPNFGLNHQPPPHVKLLDDEEWYYHPYQEYRIKKKGKWGW